MNGTSISLQITRLKISLTILILLLLPALLTAQEPAWLVRLKQQKWMSKVATLKLLETNRVEAEKILGARENSDFETEHTFENYTISSGRVLFQYSTKECTSINGKVAQNTIEDIYFSPKSNISFSKLRLPLKQFKYTPNSDTPGGSYENEQAGISISVQENGRVYSVDFQIVEQKNYSCVTVASFLKDFEKVKSLKLLASNRDDINKLFAVYDKSKDYDGSEYTETYYSGDASFKFFYSVGKCEFDNSDGYDTNQWNVEKIKISPVNNIDPQEFGINLAQYKKEKVYQNRNDLYLYYDKDSGISFKVISDKIDEIDLFPSQKYYSLMCDKEKANILSSTDSLFTENLNDRVYNPAPNASVEKLYLSRSEIIAGNFSADASQSKNLEDDPQTIRISTRVNNPENNVLTYSYTVSAGKIIGRGEKVIWDLSGVKAGTYTITAAVDDGCGFCGQPATATLTIK